MANAVVFDVMGTLVELAPLRERLEAIGAPGQGVKQWVVTTSHTKLLGLLLRTDAKAALREARTDSRTHS